MSFVKLTHNEQGFLLCRAGQLVLILCDSSARTAAEPAQRHRWG